MSSMKRRAGGPFSDGVNSALEACFGPEVGGLTASFGDDAFNSSIGALASTAGSEMSFTSGIVQDLSDPMAMEVIGHEVAHALAGGGAGASGIDQAGDPGEASADRSGRAFAQFVTQGGPAPQLGPALGGLAAIHRFESAEHQDAVDGAGDRILLNAYMQGNLSDSQRSEIEGRLAQEPELQAELDALQQTRPGQLPDAVEADPDVLDLMSQPVMLQNGVELTPGQITALMGDFYGVFDADGNLDPVATFEQMNQANPEEMARLTDCLERESKGEVIEAAEWEEITRMRRNDTRDFNGDGVADNMTYLELAERNDAHFSGETMEGVDNNMGVYTILHQAALQAASDGDLERAKGLEAASMHYLTDRHASGHAFVKDGVMDASGESNDKLANLYVKGVHDDYNENGMTLTNGEGESWHAMGDGHWHDGQNTANRSRTAESVYTSYSELEAAASGAQTPDEIAAEGYGAHETVGQFDRNTQDEAEQRARDMTRWEAIWNVKEEADLMPDMAKWWISDTWEDTTDWVGDRWTGATDWVGDQWDGATDWAEDRWDAGTDWAGNQWDAGTDWAADQWNGATDWAGDQWDGATDWGQQAWRDSTDWAGNQWDAGTDWASRTATDTWDSSTDWAGSQWDGATDWASDRAQDAGNAWDSSADWLDDRASEVGEHWDSATDWASNSLDDTGAAVTEFFGLHS